MQNLGMHQYQHRWRHRNFHGVMLFVSLAGVFQFITLPKEQFPDIVIPNIYIQTIYAGNTPRDIESLVTQPIEKQIKSITGVKLNKVTSTSQQDFSIIIVEFGSEDGASSAFSMPDA